MIIPGLKRHNKNNRIYMIWGLILIAGTLLVLTGKSMQKMVDIATTLSFVTAPILAILNHLAVTRSGMPISAAPPLWLRIFSIVSIVVLSAFSVYYIVWRYFN